MLLKEAIVIIYMSTINVKFRTKLRKCSSTLVTKRQNYVHAHLVAIFVFSLDVDISFCNHKIGINWSSNLLLYV